MQTAFSIHTTIQCFNAMCKTNSLNKWNWNNNDTIIIFELILVPQQEGTFSCYFNLLKMEVCLTWIKGFSSLRWEICVALDRISPFAFCCNPTSKLKCNLIITIPNWRINFRSRYVLCVLCVNEKDKHNRPKLSWKLYRKIWIWNLK